MSEPNAEAIKYRQRAKAAEQERDALAATVTSLRRAEVERLAGQDVKVPSSLWAAGVELNDLLDEAGNVDAKKVQAATIDAAERLGLTRNRAGVSPREGRNGRPKADRSFASAFRA